MTERIGAHIMTGMGVMFAMISPSVIPIILSSLASAMAIVSYFYQIKKNRKP